jgi:hypothetical protein
MGEGDRSSCGFRSGRPVNLRRHFGGEISFSDHSQRRCDKAAPAAAVMLHLRSCYVSKAAILTVPVQPVPVENRSPA